MMPGAASPPLAGRWWAALAAGVVLSLGLAWAGWRAWGPGYPGLQQAGRLGGVRVTTLGLGHCLTIDQHFFTPDQAAAVGAWLEAQGWRPLVPLRPAWRIGALAGGHYYFTGGQGPTEVFQRRALCLTP